mmetsp:Transcript_22991/g.42306  ORF Transcript_22991/g.42306 Transcript_22991/m.42306 type:complete len:254 (+) Transcript_22991:2263-3024(+)
MPNHTVEACSPTLFQPMASSMLSSLLPTRQSQANECRRSAISEVLPCHLEVRACVNAPSKRSTMLLLHTCRRVWNSEVCLDNALEVLLGSPMVGHPWSCDLRPAISEQTAISCGESQCSIKVYDLPLARDSTGGLHIRSISQQLNQAHGSGCDGFQYLTMQWLLLKLLHISSLQILLAITGRLILLRLCQMASSIWKASVWDASTSVSSTPLPLSYRQGKGPAQIHTPLEGSSFASHSHGVNSGYRHGSYLLV